MAVIDTGIDYNHPDLAANIWRNPGETGLDARHLQERKTIMIIRDKKYWPSVAASLASVFGLLASTIAPATQARGTPNPTVIPHTARPYGLSYGQWSARWWQFVFSIPAADNPQLHDDKCEVGQSGPVWFLTGKFCVEESCQSFLSATRSCTIPAGKALFFPIVLLLSAIGRGRRRR